MNFEIYGTKKNTVKKNIFIDRCVIRNVKRKKGNSRNISFNTQHLF